MKFSITIPAYEYKGNGATFLTHLLNTILDQDYSNYEVVISDQSKDNAIKDVCKIYSKYIEIYHHFNRNPGMGENFNNAIRHSNGDLIKIMCLDDYFIDPSALTKIKQSIKNTWLVSGCVHSKRMFHFYDRMVPYYRDDIHLGRNSISSPSVLTLKEKILFDDTLTMLLDCEMYKRLYTNYGFPDIIEDPLICNRMHQDQAQNEKKNILDKEIEYCRKLYE